MFPRSTAPEPGGHGTFKDCEERLSYVAEMGFDVVYLPPIHPIGREHRKGKNNARVAAEADVGSPWAIGASEGGHKAVHPQLGTLSDFRQLVERARALDIDIALDIAFQVAPDHPYVQEHPQWFQRRPDGTIQYAENPPKKYEDIYPFDFETSDWKALWRELESVFRHWCEQGVRIFRVDNPHTKPFAMWEWLIRSIKSDFPETIFLAEAFTRPKVMHRLAKLGFAQSYTYFAWRNTKYELTEYLSELTQTKAVEYMRPNFWPNTPDILTEFLQTGKRPAFMLRVALAATMTASYGIYGPAFELMEHVPAHPGSEEYLHSEKYQVRHWNLDEHHSLKDYIGRLNRIRKENPALHQNRMTTFHHVGNDWLMAFSKRTADGENTILTVANLDVDYTQSGMVDLDLDALGLEADKAFQVHDLVDDARYVWQGHRNYVELDPKVSPVHVFRIGHKLRSERDFDYYT
jgi:starch synthase (maltosyl-transferring)